MLRSKTRVMPAIMVTAVLSPQASWPWQWGQNRSGCGLCSLEVHHLQGSETCPHMSTLSAPGSDLDTDPENAVFAASQVCTESWLG